VENQRHGAKLCPARVIVDQITPRKLALGLA
jgi:hypothetical protein